MRTLLGVMVITVLASTIALPCRASLPEIRYMTPQQYFRIIWITEGEPEWKIKKMEQIIFHESRWDPYAQNKVSSAAGIFQIVRGTWAGNSAVPFDQYKYDFRENIRTGYRIYKARGFQPWGK